MAPPASQKQKTPAMSSQEGALLAAINRFCQEMGKERKIAGPIAASQSLSSLRESIRTYRKSDQTIPVNLIDDLVTSIENEDNSLCHRFEPQIFSVVIDAMLQAEPCRNAERGLYLLSASLFEKKGKSQSQRGLVGRKDQIGKDSLLPLLEFFLNGKNFYGLRRWAGILCGQLFSECPPNYERLELGSDDLRQRVGPRMIEESDELVRVICGQLVRDLNTSGLPLAVLFPTNYDEKLYNDFPPSTQGNTSWGALFDNYVDLVLPLANQAPPDETLYFGWGFSLQPEFPFGVPGRNVYMLFGAEDLTIMALASETNIDQLLDIPLETISRMTFIPGENSQSEVEMMIQLDKNNQFPCHLDASPVSLDFLYVTIRLENVGEFEIRLKESCPQLSVTEDQDDGLINENGQHNSLASQKSGAAQEEIAIDREGGGNRVSEDDIASEVDYENFLNEQLASREEDAITIDREDARNSEPENRNGEGNNSMASNRVSLPQAQNAIVFEHESAGAYQESERGDESPPSVPTQVREETLNEDRNKEDSLGVRSGLTVNLYRERGDASDQTSDDDIYNASPTGGKKRALPHAGAKPAGKPSRPEFKNTVSKLRLPARKQTIKPKAKTPIANSVKSSQAQVVPIRSAPNSKVEALNEKQSKPLYGLKRGSGKVSQQTQRIKAHQEAAGKAQTPRDVVLNDDNDDTTTLVPEDASTPQTRTQKPMERLAGKVSEDTKAKSQSLANGVTATGAPKAGSRYSLYPASKLADPFALPEDEDDNGEVEGKTVEKKKTTAVKPKLKVRKSAGAINTKTAIVKVDAKKKRQSAPAQLQITAPTRQSQRGAAAKANAKMKSVDTIPDEIDAEEESQLLEANAASKNDVQKERTAQPTLKPKIVDADGDESVVLTVVDEDSTKTLTLKKASQKIVAKKLKVQATDDKESGLEEAEILQPELLKKKSTSKQKEIQRGDAKSQSQTQFFDVSGSLEAAKSLQMKVPKKAAIPRKRARRNAPVLSEVRVQNSDLSENAEKVDQEQISEPEQAVASHVATNKPATKSQVTIHNGDASDDGADALQKIMKVRGKASALKAAAKISLVNSRVAKVELVEKGPITKRPEPKLADPLPSNSEIDDVDLNMQQAGAGTLELAADDFAIIPHSDMDEAAQTTQVVQLTKSNATIETKVTKTYSKLKGSTIGWAEMIDSMLDSEPEASLRPVATKKQEPKSASGNTSVFAKQLEHNIQPTTITAPAMAEEIEKPTRKEFQHPQVQTPIIEREYAVQVLDSGTEKKRKSAEADKQLSNKRRNTVGAKGDELAQDEVEPTATKSLPSIKPPKPKGTAAAVFSTTDEEPKYPSKSSKKISFISHRDDPTKDSSKNTRTLATGSMGPPPPLAGQSKTKSGAFLVDEYLMRKPHVISFDADGPRNQGLPSAHEVSAQQATQISMLADNESMIVLESADLKRKLDIFASGTEQSLGGPLKKKHSLSPPMVIDELLTDEEAHQVIGSSSPLAYREFLDDEDMALAIYSSLPKAVIAVARARTQAKRQSSQSSRVDHNGSPIASPSIEVVDHLGKLKQQVLGDIRAATMENPGDSCGEEPVKSKTNYLASMFEPRISLGSQPKARPSSQSDSGDRYVAHEKTEKGHYKGIRTKELVEEQQELADPFSAKKPDRSNSFLQRLKDKKDTRDVGSMLKHKEVRQLEVWDEVRTDSKTKMLTQPVKASSKGKRQDNPNLEGELMEPVQPTMRMRTAVNIKHPKAQKEPPALSKSSKPLFTRGFAYRVSIEDEDKTLVNERSRQFNEQSSPSDMASGYSLNSSQVSRPPLVDKINDDETWNLALRPHYAQAADALHRAVDETLIQLSGKEEGMELLITDYKGKGSKVMSDFEADHNEQSSRVQKLLQRKNDAVVKCYKDANELVGEKSRDSKEDSVASFEKEWKKQQGRIQDKISKGLDQSE